MNTIKATFTLPDVEAYILQQKTRGEQAFLNVLNFAALEFVNEARSKTTYQDRTGNLRSSIGYIILQNGQQIFQDFRQAEVPIANPTEGEQNRPKQIIQDGVQTGIDFAATIASEYPKGIVLVCVAGMEYALYVEAKGFDVITESSLNLITRIKTLLAQL
jgi:hypothetical protein